MNMFCSFDAIMQNCPSCAVVKSTTRWDLAKVRQPTDSASSEILRRRPGMCRWRLIIRPNRRGPLPQVPPGHKMSRLRWRFRDGCRLILVSDSEEEPLACCQSPCDYDAIRRHVRSNRIRQPSRSVHDNRICRPGERRDGPALVHGANKCRGHQKRQQRELSGRHTSKVSRDQHTVEVAAERQLFRYWNEYN